VSSAASARWRSVSAAAEIVVSVILCALVVLFLGIPILAIIERAFSQGDFFDAISSSGVTEALRLSLITTTISLLIIVLFGTPVAYILSRGDFPGRNVIDALIDLPIVLPPAVGGLGLLMAFGRRGMFGSYLDDAGINIAFTMTAVIMAQTFVASPFYIRSAKAGFDSIERDLEAVAHTLGSSRFEAFRRIAIPVAMPSLMAGAVMSWARALGEFGATIMFAGSFAGRTQTIPLAIYRYLETGIDVPLALSALLIFISFAVLFVFRLVTRRAVLTL
jgi:molybdate transport system permease protein